MEAQPAPGKVDRIAGEDILLSIRPAANRKRQKLWVPSKTAVAFIPGAVEVGVGIGIGIEGNPGRQRLFVIWQVPVGGRHQFGTPDFCFDSDADPDSDPAR
jgi:hypothetical protein